MAVGFRMVRHWPSQVIIVAAALLFIGVQATLAYRYISADKAQTIEAAYADDEAVVLAVNAHIGAVLQLADSTLQQLGVHIEQHGGLQSLDPAVLHDMLLLHAQGATMLRAIIVVAPDGTAITSSTDVHSRLPNLHDRESVRVHRQPAAPAGLHVAEPIEGASGIWMLPLSRSVRRADGTLDAVLITTLNLDGIRALYDSLSMRDNGTTLGLVRNDGEQLARIPFARGVMGHVQPGGQRIAASMATQPKGRLEEKSGVEDARRLYAYHRLAEYPVAVYAGKDIDAVLEPWRARTGERIRTMLGLSLLLLAFAIVAAIKVGRLSRSEERLERAAHATSAGVWELGLHSGRMWRSEQWSSLLGYAAAEIPLTLDGFLSVVHVDDLSFVRQAMEGLTSSSDPLRLEYRVRRKDGSFIWVECTAHIFDHGSAPAYAVGSMCDITRRKDIELSLHDNARMLNLAQRAADAGVWSVDLRTGSTRWSDECYRVYGVNPVSASPNAADWEELIYRPDRERVIRVVKDSMEQHAEFSAEFRIVHPDKGIRWLWALGNTLRDEQGAPSQMAGITLDITARKKSEEERQALLASERAARAEAERAGRAKEEFLAVVSHELRTPLNSILGWVHVLRTRDKEPELFARSVESIERCAHVQAQLIADLLDISRIEAGTLRLDAEVVSLQPILEAAVSAIVPVAEAKGVWLMCEPGAANVRADSARLEQVMWNLLSNAIKFTPKGGVVNVTSQVVDGEVEIRVSDNGAGIPRDFLPHLFTRFCQSERTRQQSLGGLGLGLTIVKHLVEAHGGRVRVDSEGEGRGATATVWLPLAEAHRRDDRPADVRPAMPVALNGIRVLLVEDDADSREVAMLILAGHGAEVTMTNSVEGAWQQLLRFVPQVIVADLSMPEKDGFELMRMVRSAGNAKLRAVPALALSALASAEDRARALAGGFDMHVAKPVEPQVLLESVAVLAARREADSGSSRSPLREAMDPVSWSESER